MATDEQSSTKAIGEHAPKIKRPASFWVALALACFSLISYGPRLIVTIREDGGPEGLLGGLALFAAIAVVVIGSYTWWSWLLVSRTKQKHPEGFVMFLVLHPELGSSLRSAAGPAGLASRMGILMMLVVDGNDVRLLRGPALKTVAVFPQERICAVGPGKTISNYRSIDCVAVEVETDSGTQVLPFVPSDYVRWWRILRAKEVAGIAEKMQRMLGLPIGDCSSGADRINPART